MEQTCHTSSRLLSTIIVLAVNVGVYVFWRSVRHFVPRIPEHAFLGYYFILMPLGFLMREIRRRTRVVGCFPDGESALMLVAARLRHIASTRWGYRSYLNVKLIQEQEAGMQVG